MPEFILKLEEKDKASLAAARCIEGLQAAEEEGHIWLKGIATVDERDARLRQLPIKNTFIADEMNNLFLPGALVPVAVLKELKWLPLTEFIKVESPDAALPGTTEAQVILKLIVSGQEREGRALLTTLKAWKLYAETASETRLQPLKFAVSERNEVLIIGRPLPPLPGKEYWETDNILLPAGYDFELSIMPSFITKRLNENKQAIIVFDKEGQWQKIDKACFVPAKRSAVRLTKLNND